MESSYRAASALLRQKLVDASDSKPVLLYGPRHVGKTTLLLGLARDLGDRAIHVSGDDPTVLLPESWTRLWEDAEGRSRRVGVLTVMLDEVGQWPDWRRRIGGVLKHLGDGGAPVRVVAAASADDHDLPGSGGLAFDRVRISHWSASSIAEAFDVDPIEAAGALVSFGGYPGAYQFMADRPRWSTYVRESIVEPALGRDVGALVPIRQPSLLRQVFAIAARHPCETISLQRMQAVLLQTGALTTIAGYLKRLEQVSLVAALPRHSSGTRTRRRSAPPKLVVLNNALLSALHPSGPPDRTREPERYDAWIENACLAHAINSGQHVSYWREEPFDVDAVITGDWGKWAIEVMPNVHSSVDYRGLHEFVARYPDFQPLVVTSDANSGVAVRAGLRATTWQRFLLEGPLA